MKDQETCSVDELISALVDEEVSEFELHRILKSLDDNVELRKRWHRYQVVAATLHGRPPVVRRDLSQQITEAIGAEPDIKVWRWRRSLSKMAVAASVTVFAVLGVQQVANFSDRFHLDGQRSQAEFAGAESEYVAPQFQFPAGFEMPRVNVRNVSTGRDQITAPLEAHSVGSYSDLETHRQIQNYLHRLILGQAALTLHQSNQGALSDASLPVQQDVQ